MEKKIKFRGIFRERFAKKKMADLVEISRKNSGQISPKTIVKKKPISRKFSGQISLESDRFCADFTNVFNETRRQFCPLLGRGNDDRWPVQ